MDWQATQISDVMLLVVLMGSFVIGLLGLFLVIFAKDIAEVIRRLRK